MPTTQTHGAPATRDPTDPAGRIGRPWSGETYYGLPAVKASPWDWKVSTYIFIAGMSGAAQIVATAADLAAGGRAAAIVRRGRYLALLAPVVGGPLLIADLHTPRRFYNMFRIYRGTSPMSIGTYVLSAFSAFSGLGALGQLIADRKGRGAGAPAATLARVAQVPAALAGAAMCVYPAALLAATSTPLWGRASRLLAVRFACSSLATAAAALSLRGAPADRREDASARRDLDSVALVALAGQAAAEIAARRAYRGDGVSAPLEKGDTAMLDKLGAAAIGVALPMALYALNLTRRRRSTGLSMLASLAVLGGGLAMRHAALDAGNRSATRPTDYFRVTQPRPASTREGARPDAHAAAGSSAVQPMPAPAARFSPTPGPRVPRALAARS
jgi:formate-dependent nitrite reductase membrane component NrfD